MVADANGALISRRWLQIEFAALYFGAPLMIALFLPPRQMFSALALFSMFGMGLLWFTGGFQFRTLIRGWRQIPWREVAGISVAVMLSGIVILSLFRPDDLFLLLRLRPELIPFIWALYPLLSALPQELIFRPLFFYRYGAILPQGKNALILNAAVFSFAHLMYWSWIVALMTFIGGYIFARAYLRYGFPAVWILHAVAGNIIFLVGLGAYFYTGNVVRPF
ncbi:CPBP family glutamic-type intramembrane protease [Paracoccus sp. (in: a-proteobacteria)]|uniref:CPBP family glutamic-type intramembrane protease n=1 Tax=Paracoccus sp. TaxID=267 RepID=UPI0026E0EBA9|nr:CPBP family glutamic-type intramembrane protease [Paracoccus sp. (in: a-proteobacteria)]MDO5647937.1 CPBP family glutamic-type intramembrane protease [Paracoccus sp. (in: a-proteobacteria)]